MLAQEILQAKIDVINARKARAPKDQIRNLRRKVDRLEFPPLDQMEAAVEAAERMLYQHILAGGTRPFPRWNVPPSPPPTPEPKSPQPSAPSSSDE